jgi:hypothetical protein
MRTPVRTHIRLARPQRRSLTIARTVRPALSRPLARAEILRPLQRDPFLRVPESDLGPSIQPDPYGDYGRFLTPEGGIRLIYKDLDVRLRHTLWRLLAWMVATGLEGAYLLHQSNAHSPWVNLGFFLAVALLNWLIVRKPVEVYRTLDILPHAMILEGRDLFWRRFMEGDWPMLRSDSVGNFILCGIYGTRFVEYLTVRRFDAQDRTPEVLAAHLLDAMQQLWTKPY